MLGCRSNDGGTSGVRPDRSARRSTAVNAAAAMGANTRSAMVHAGHPSERPSVSGRSTASKVAPSKTVPGPSIGAGAPCRVSGTYRLASTSPASPIGTLTRKIGRQPSPSMLAETSKPPSTWPSTAARPPAAP